VKGALDSVLLFPSQPQLPPGSLATMELKQFYEWSGQLSSAVAYLHSV
jgi:hypothetical protein